MSEAKDDYSGGDKVNASEVNQISKNANDAGGFRDNLLAGETIAGETLPVPVYQKTTDNEFYKCDADDTAKLNFVGFAISNGTNGNAMDIQMNGIVKGFTGLDEGEKYYVQDAVGTIGKTKGTYEILVGVAISTTELLIMKGSWELIGADTLSANSSTVQVSDTSTIPSGTRFIVVQLNSYSEEAGIYRDVQSSNILLIKGLIDTGYHSIYNVSSASNATDYKGVKASISGSILTCETLLLEVGGGRSVYLSGTVKYFD